MPLKYVPLFFGITWLPISTCAGLWDNSLLLMCCEEYYREIINGPIDSDFLCNGCGPLLWRSVSSLLPNLLGGLFEKIVSKMPPRRGEDSPLRITATKISIILLPWWSTPTASILKWVAVPTTGIVSRDLVLDEPKSFVALMLSRICVVVRSKVIWLTFWTGRSQFHFNFDMSMGMWAMDGVELFFPGGSCSLPGEKLYIWKDWPWFSLNCSSSVSLVLGKVLPAPSGPLEVCWCIKTFCMILVLVLPPTLWCLSCSRIVSEPSRLCKTEIRPTFLESSIVSSLHTCSTRWLGIGVLRQGFPGQVWNSCAWSGLISGFLSPRVEHMLSWISFLRNEFRLESSSLLKLMSMISISLISIGMTHLSPPTLRAWRLLWYYV